ncbi:MAG: hypothetical protein Q8S31_03730 [Alphaproteobacteria bacterium]|nr:hypothetical protein [Alphaproteobacteria bacterium]
MKKLAFLISTLTLLNGNVNAFGEDDLDYQEQLRQSEAAELECSQNINTMFECLQTLMGAEQNAENTWFSQYANTIIKTKNERQMQIIDFRCELQKKEMRRHLEWVKSLSEQEYLDYLANQEPLPQLD